MRYFLLCIIIIFIMDIGTIACSRARRSRSRSREARASKTERKGCSCSAGGCFGCLWTREEQQQAKEDAREEREGNIEETAFAASSSPRDRSLASGPAAGTAGLI